MPGDETNLAELLLSAAEQRPEGLFFLSRCALKIRFFGTLHDFSPEKMDASNSIYQNMIWGPSMAPSTLFSTWPTFTCKQIH